MTEITRFSGRSDWIELNFVGRERTPSELIKLVIRLHLTELSHLNTTREF
jgi:putative transposase